MIRAGWSLLIVCFFAAAPLRAEQVTEQKVLDVAKELACLCGSCPTRPLHECRCGYAGQQRDRIAKELDQGRSKETIIAGYVAEFGERIYVTPPKEGFNLLAWFMPFIGLLVGGVLVRSVLKGWSRKAEAPSSAASESGTTVDADRARLDAALKEREL